MAGLNKKQSVKGLLGAVRPRPPAPPPPSPVFGLGSSLNPSGSMYPYSIYLGLKVVPIWGTLESKYAHKDTWTLRELESLFKVPFHRGAVLCWEPEEAPYLRERV